MTGVLVGPVQLATSMSIESPGSGGTQPLGSFGPPEHMHLDGFEVINGLQTQLVSLFDRHLQPFGL